MKNDITVTKDCSIALIIWLNSFTDPESQHSCNAAGKINLPENWYTK